MLIYGGLAVVVLWAMLVAGVARCAQARGRSAGIWAIGAGVGGGIGFSAGLALTGTAVDRDAEVGVMLMSAMAPLLLMAGVMIGVAIYILYAPIAATRRARWAVHVHELGAGELRIDPDRLTIACEHGTREIERARIRTIELDGECVRVHHGDTELAILPIGQPQTPAGRRTQSVQLAHRLRAR